MGDSEIPLIWR